MKEASYDDATRISAELNIRTEDIWRIIRGLQYSNPVEMRVAVHEAFRLTPSKPAFPDGERR
jgi:hypothetical protein